MSTIQRSPAFRAFDRAQQQVNAFLWSSEFAYELVRQRILTEDVRTQSAGVHEVFKGVACHAFIPTNKAMQKIRQGRKPRFPAKYHANPIVFETDLRNNLEQICRHVIVRFHTALEQYLFVRTRLLLKLDELPTEKKQKARIDSFLKTSYVDMQRVLSEDPFRVPFGENKIDHECALLAQVFRELRHHVVHRETKEEWQPPWKDQQFREELLQKKFILDKVNISVVRRKLFRRIDERIARQEEVPLLFYYALFSLTDVRKFAISIDAALPAMAG